MKNHLIKLFLGLQKVPVFLSFHCSACTRRFGSILKLIESNNKIKVQLILSPSKDEVSIQFIKAIYTMLHSGKHKQILEKLNNWYKTEKAGRSKLVSEINAEGEVEGFDQMIEYNSKLFEKGKVVVVPSVFLNGYPLPPTYKLEDLRYHITALGSMRTILDEIKV